MSQSRAFLVSVLALVVSMSACASAPQHVRFRREVTIPGDSGLFFPGGQEWSGRIDSGSKCVEQSRKGAAVYVSCPLVVVEDVVERIPKKDD